LGTAKIKTISDLKTIPILFFRLLEDFTPSCGSFLLQSGCKYIPFFIPRKRKLNFFLHWIVPASFENSGDIDLSPENQNIVLKFPPVKKTTFFAMLGKKGSRKFKEFPSGPFGMCKKV